MRKLTTIINIFGGPGIGKSGVAAGLYSKMKANHMSVELVTEVAKDYVWEERLNVLTHDQIIIFAEQHRRMDRLRDRVDYIVTDCPILLCIPYVPPNAYYKDLLVPLMVECALSFDNFNVILERNEESHTDLGRYHSLDESKQKDLEIMTIVNHYDPKYYTTPVDIDTVDRIFKQLTLTN